VRWPVFAVFAFVCFVLEVSVRNMLRLEALFGVSPSFVACLATFVALFGQRLSALWACWILGMMMDLMPRSDGATMYPIGPHALAYIAGGYLIVLLRTMVFRRRLLSFGAMTFIFLMSASIVTVAVLLVRHWYAPVDSIAHEYHGLSDLAGRALISLYSGVIGFFPVGSILIASMPLWGFQSSMPRR
jgi:rod shape-determining protein MreD